MNPHDIHALDQQIAAALIGEPSPEQLARLEAVWRQMSRREKQRREVRFASAIAATLLVAATTAVWLVREPARQPIAVNRPAPGAPAPKVKESSPPPQLAEADAESPVQTSLSAGRPPTAYEQVVFAVRTRESVDARSQELATAVDAAIEGITRDPKADAHALLASANLAHADAERLLLGRLRRASNKQKPALAKLLSACATQRALPALVQLAHRKDLQGDLLPVIERIAGPANLAVVIRQTPDRELRAALFDHLLAADAEPALRGYLSLISNGAFRGEALAAADRVARPPVGPLMTLLQDNEKPVRLAAALALGRMNGPDVTAALIAVVTEDPSNSTEAWIALWACRGESAEQFLAGASREPRMLGHVNNARVFWAQMIQ